MFKKKGERKKNMIGIVQTKRKKKNIKEMIEIVVAAVKRRKESVQTNELMMKDSVFRDKSEAVVETSIERIRNKKIKSVDRDLTRESTAKIITDVILIYKLFF